MDYNINNFITFHMVSWMFLYGMMAAVVYVNYYNVFW